MPTPKRKGSAKRKGPSKQHIEVVTRSRPLNSKERAEGDASYCVSAGKPKGELATVKLLVEAGDSAPGIPGAAGEVQRYDFCVDRAFYQDDSNEDVYGHMGESILDTAFAGYNVCILAYGQTGSGKTHTVLGKDKDPGIVPRLCADLFRRRSELEEQVDITVEMVEVYGKEERMTDLLSDEQWGTDSRLRLRQQDPTTFIVQGTKAYRPTSQDEMMTFIRAGIDKRTVAETAMNHESSRSHSILTIGVKQHRGKTMRVGKIRVVDLAGSENIGRSMATGQQVTEAIAINSSLSVLRRVLTALAEGKDHVPFRDSVLTRLLADSLTGNSRTTIITTVSPARSNAAESKSTLGYGATARRIKTKPVVNDDNEFARLAELEAEIERLRKLAGGKAASGGGGAGEAGGGGEAEKALAEAEKTLAAERAGRVAREGELAQLEQETRLRLGQMAASQARMAERAASMEAKVQKQQGELDERERRLAEMEARLMAREQEVMERETSMQSAAKEAGAATVLAAVCRAWALRSQFKANSAAARKIQPLIRRRIVVRLWAVGRLQAWARAWLARRAAAGARRRRLYGSEEAKWAATRIQGGVRGREGRLRAARLRRRREAEEREQAGWRRRQGQQPQSADPFGELLTPEPRRQPQPQAAQHQRASPAPLRPQSGNNYQSSLPEPVLTRGAAATIVERTHASLDAKAAKARGKRRVPTGARLAGDLGRLDKMFGRFGGGGPGSAGSSRSSAGGSSTGGGGGGSAPGNSRTPSRPRSVEPIATAGLVERSPSAGSIGVSDGGLHQSRNSSSLGRPEMQRHRSAPVSYNRRRPGAARQLPAMVAKGSFPKHAKSQKRPSLAKQEADKSGRNVNFAPGQTGRTRGPKHGGGLKSVSMPSIRVG